jgi:predicted NBD/HSP70 family sugar kinase
VDPAKPSLDLVRSLTDEHVLRALMRHRRLTRAELAQEIGISKPTAGESVRRLAERGLVVDTGERTAGGRGRGRVGSYYALSGGAGTALAISIAPEGILAERVDAYGDTIARAHHHIARPARPQQVSAALRTAVTEVTRAADRPPRLAVVSAADPVDRATGRLIQLPDAPFLVGELDPMTILAPFVDGPVTVDNDVNWAAQAERDHAGAEALRHFAYLYLGEGLGCAIVSDGEVKRGAGGLAGEIAHLITIGPHGRAVRLIDIFGELGLRQPGSTAVHVERLLTACDDPAPDAAATRETLGQAIGGVLAAIVALTDPERIIIGGPWASAVLDSIRVAASRLPRQPRIQAADLTGQPAFLGARADALRRLRALIATAP